jgi:putative membrane protein
MNRFKIMKTILSLLFTVALATALTARAAGPNDAQIAAIVVTANQVDIDAGKLVSNLTANADVKSFAERMVTDHTAVNAAAVALVTRLHVTPEDNDTSRALQAAGDANLAHLRTLQGRDLDKAYIDHEVAYHEQVINALDQVLIPNASNAELKGLLVKVRPAFVEHLGHAKHLQATYQ